jgi:ribosomal protein L30/L7E
MHHRRWVADWSRPAGEHRLGADQRTRQGLIREVVRTHSPTGRPCRQRECFANALRLSKDNGEFTVRNNLTSRNKFILVTDDPTDLTIRTWEDLYDLWLLPTLLAQPPLRLYPKPLVDFADSVLCEPAADIDWIYNREAVGVRTALGDVLKQLKATKPMENFSAVAMEFAGYKFEEGLSRGPVAADRMCLALVDFLRLRPAYIRRVRRGSKKYLTGTERFRRESGMRLWLQVV